MKYLKLFEAFNKKGIHNICREYHIKNYAINEDGTIDVDGNVNLDRYDLTKLPLKFKNVSGYFDCSYNQLTSLEGCPKSVGGDFDCSDNKLASLEGCPESVGGEFYCSYNKITTFEHLPFSIDGYFICYNNPIYQIWKLFEDYSKIEFLNDCDPIREPNIIILDRLNFFLEEIGKEAVTEVEGYKCI